MELFRDTHFDFMKYRRFWIVVSFLLVLGGVYAVFGPDQEPRSMALTAELKRVAEDRGVGMAQLAIAWLLSRKPEVVPLVGTSKRKWLEENAKAADVRLSETTLAALDKTFKPGIARGDRYPAPMMARLGL